MKHQDAKKKCYSKKTLLQLKLEKYSLEVSPQGRGLFFNQMNGEILSLNCTGAFVVLTLRESITFGDLTEMFAIKFGITREAAEEDIQEFLDTLYNINILQID